MDILNTGWFKVIDFEKGIRGINDNNHDMIYLVEGKEKALLIDTGFGIGNLPELVKSLTSLPVIVVNTHGHPDHVLGGSQFPNIHIYHEDMPLLKGCFLPENLKWAIDNVIQGPFPEDFSQEAWLNAKINNITTIKEGFTFDLGDREMEIIAIPGHTPGSIGLLDKAGKLFFSGDSIAACDMWLHLEESLPLSEYRNSLKRVRSLFDSFDKIMPAHGKTPLNKDIVNELIAGVTDVIQGNLIGIKHHTFAGDGVLYRFTTCGVVAKN